MSSLGTPSRYQLNMGGSSELTTWPEWFLNLKGNEYYCEVDADFIEDRFNMTGIGHDVPHFKKAYELICGTYGKLDC